MDKELYYTAPSQEIFDEVRKEAINIWVDLNPRFHHEKTDYLKKLENIRDNFMVIVAMFDCNNQRTLAIKISAEARKAISDRMRDAEYPDLYNYFKY